MISREQWGAKPLTKYAYKIEPSYRTGIVVHHSVTAEGRSLQDVKVILRQIDDMHRAQGWGGIGYNLAVDYAGRIYRARGVNVMGVHTADNNSRNYGVCYIGDGREGITRAAVAAIRDSVKFLQDNSKKKLKIRGHQDLNPTACPGPHIQRLVESGRFKVGYN